MGPSLPRFIRLAAASCFFVGSVLASDEEVFLAPERFISSAFADGDAGEPRRLWLTADLKPSIKQILGHDYAALRLRYWQRGTRSAWILEEIGKVRPITTGIVIDDGRISDVEVLVYRESHGWEVKHDFFTDQFRGAALTEGLKLSDPIDSIAGATLSVNALKKLGRLALYLDQHVQDSTDS